MAFSSAVQLDTVHLKEVLREIVLNALEAMPDGGEVRVTTTRRDEPEGRPVITLEVADTGRGITAEALPHVSSRSSPFVQTERGLVCRLSDGLSGRMAERWNSRVGRIRAPVCA